MRSITKTNITQRCTQIENIGDISKGYGIFQILLHSYSNCLKTISKSHSPCLHLWYSMIVYRYNMIVPDPSWKRLRHLQLPPDNASHRRPRFLRPDSPPEAVRTPVRWSAWTPSTFRPRSFAAGWSRTRAGASGGRRRRPGRQRRLPHLQRCSGLTAVCRALWIDAIWNIKWKRVTNK